MVPETSPIVRPPPGTTNPSAKDEKHVWCQSKEEEERCDVEIAEHKTRRPDENTEYQGCLEKDEGVLI